MNLFNKIKEAQQKITQFKRESNICESEFVELIEEILIDFETVGNFRICNMERAFSLKRSNFDKLFEQKNNGEINNTVKEDSTPELAQNSNPEAIAQPSLELIRQSNENRPKLKSLYLDLLNITSELRNSLKIVSKDILFEILCLVDIEKLVFMSPNTIRYLKKDLIFEKDPFVKKCRYEMKKKMKLFIANKFKIGLMMDVYGAKTTIACDIVGKYYEKLVRTRLNKKLVFGNVRKNTKSKKIKKQMRIRKKCKRVYMSDVQEK